MAVAAGVTALAVVPGAPTIALALLWHAHDTPPAVKRFVELARHISAARGWRTPAPASPARGAP